MLEKEGQFGIDRMYISFQDETGQKKEMTHLNRKMGEAGRGQTAEGSAPYGDWIFLLYVMGAIGELF